MCCHPLSCKRSTTIPKAYEDTPQDPALGLITFQGMELYYRPEKIKEIQQQGYDFIVSDHGLFSQMELSSYLEKDIKVIVCGCKPHEVAPLTEVFRKLENEEIHYLFSFAHANEHINLRAEMGEKGEVTHFPAYSPSPWDLNSENEHIFRSILGKCLSQQEPAKTEAVKGKKLKWFGGR